MKLAALFVFVAATSWSTFATPIVANTNDEQYLQFLETGEFEDNLNQEIECLTENIYHEARGEPEIGQIAVAQVTMNRVNHWYFPDTVCDVVWQSGQFSWTQDGRSDVMHDTERAEFARDVAIRVFFQLETDRVQNALFYHATYISAPNWTSHMNLVDRIGVHKFYTWDGEWN
jgi:spore germination cell wall hydrolase CwlJ-like protein